MKEFAKDKHVEQMKEYKEVFWVNDGYTGIYDDTEITEEMVRDNLQGLDKLLNFYMSKKDSLKPLPKLIDGFEVMQIKNIKQSPKLGEIMNALKEAQINGDIVTKDEAIEFVKKYE